MMSAKKRDPTGNEARSEKAKRWLGTAAHNFKLGPRLIEDLCALVARGYPIETAADALGICGETTRQWQKKAADFRRDRGPKEWAVYERFDRAYRKARAEFLGRLIEEAVNSQEARSVKRALRILAVRDRAHWANSPASAGPASEESGYDPDERFL